MAMLAPFLDMDLDYILVQERLNVQYYEDKKVSPRSWSFGRHGMYDLEDRALTVETGKLYNSATGLFVAAGTTSRLTPLFSLIHYIGNRLYFHFLLANNDFKWLRI